jgi:hypothetical protein
METQYQSQRILKQALEEVKIEQGNVTQLSNGSYSVHRIDVCGQCYVLKLYGLERFISQAQRRVLHVLERDVGGLRYRERFPENPQLPSNIIELECTVLKAWEKEGIRSPRVIATDRENALLLSYIPAVCFKDLVEAGDYTSLKGEMLLEKIDDIRGKAFRKRDTHLLHNDMWLGNFMWSSDEEAIPIDPGVLFKKDIGFEQLDAYINLFMCYSLISEVFGYSPDTYRVHDSLLENFLETLDGSTIRRMRRLNTPANAWELAYLKATAALGVNREYNGFMQTFSPKKCKQIDRRIKARLERR